MIRKFIFLIAVGLFIGTGLISLSFAQGMNEKMGNQSMMGKDMMKSDMMANGEMMKKCPMHGMMMKGMMEKSMIATADGGVIVLSGNKLMKFDKDLNLVKEAEIKPDLEGMQKMMMQMQENCPMCKKMMEGTKEKSAESEKTDTTSEHKTHH